MVANGSVAVGPVSKDLRSELHITFIHHLSDKIVLSFLKRETVGQKQSKEKHHLR